MAESMNKLTPSLTVLYGQSPYTIPEKEVAFTWVPIKKSQQLCYSHSHGLLISISRGVSAGSLLPTQEELAGRRMFR